MKSLKALALASAFAGAVFMSFPSLANIEWHSWNSAAFEKAQREGKLIYLDVGTEWCGACNQMQRETYTDQRVQKLLRESFVCIHVDAEAEPDLGERYGFWGWPSLIFMDPAGNHVNFHRGFRPPEVFTDILRQLVDAQQQGTLSVPDVEVDLVSAPADQDMAGIVELASAMIDRFYDPAADNWSGSRMADQFLVHQAWWRGQSEGQSEWPIRALEASKRYQNMLDPEWGGVWFGSRSSDMKSGFIHERRTEHQASALAIFARAYHHTGNPAWLDSINNVMGYLDSFMANHQGTFFTSQEQDIVIVGTDITPSEYFALPDAERRRIGLPTVDTTVYADINAKLVLAFALLFETTGDPGYKARATALMEQLVSLGREQDGSYRQLLTVTLRDDRLRDVSDEGRNVQYLRTQAFIGLAALSAYRITADMKWLEEANSIADAMIRQLWHQPSKGFLGSTRTTPMPDGSALTDQPLIDTGAAVDFLNRLSAYNYGAFDESFTHTAKQLRSYAEHALRAVAAPELDAGAGQLHWPVCACPAPMA